MSERATTLVGESNPYGADSHYALYPLPERASGGRLARALGLSALEYLAAFQRLNLLTEPLPNGRLWSVPLARARAAHVLAATAKGDALVLCGAKVAAAFGFDFECALLRPAPILHLTEHARQIHAVVIPHPSGLSRVWNQRGMAERVRAALAAAVLCARRSSWRWRALMAAAKAAHWIVPGQRLYSGERTELHLHEAELELPEGGEKIVRSFSPIHISWPCSPGCWMVDGNDPACTLADKPEQERRPIEQEHHGDRAPCPNCDRPWPTDAERELRVRVAALELELATLRRMASKRGVP